MKVNLKRTGKNKGQANLVKIANQIESYRPYINSSQAVPLAMVV